MNVLIISAVFPPEPVVSAKLSFDIALELSKNHSVTVLKPLPSRPQGYEYSNDNSLDLPFSQVVLNSYVCPESKLFGRFRESWSFGKYCSNYIQKHRNQIDVIYMNTWPLAAQFFSIKAANKFKIPTVLHIQDIYPESLVQKLPFLKGLIYKILLPIDKYSIRKSKSIITISNGMAKLLEETRGISSNRFRVIYNWQDESLFGNSELKTNSIEERNPFVFMFLGSIGPVAAIDGLIKAFAKAELTGARLVIAGDGSEKKILIKLANQYPNCDIRFISAPSEQVAKIQSQSDLLILSLQKGAGKFALPSKLPAYMLSQKPIIASVDSDSDTASIVKESGCGWVVPPESLNELVMSMKNAVKLTDNELSSIGKKGFLYATEHLSKRKNLAEIVKVIEESVI